MVLTMEFFHENLRNQYPLQRVQDGAGDMQTLEINNTSGVEEPAGDGEERAKGSVTSLNQTRKLGLSTMEPIPGDQHDLFDTCSGACHCRFTCFAQSCRGSRPSRSHLEILENRVEARREEGLRGITAIYDSVRWGAEGINFSTGWTKRGETNQSQQGVGRSRCSGYYDRVLRGTLDGNIRLGLPDLQRRGRQSNSMWL